MTDRVQDHAADAFFTAPTLDQALDAKPHDAAWKDVFLAWFEGRPGYEPDDYLALLLAVHEGVLPGLTSGTAGGAR